MENRIWAYLTRLVCSSSRKKKTNTIYSTVSIIKEQGNFQLGLNNTGSHMLKHKGLSQPRTI